MISQTEDEIRVCRLTQESLQRDISSLSEDSEISIKGPELQSLKSSHSSSSKNYFIVQKDDPIKTLETKFDRQLEGVRLELDGAKCRINVLEDKVQVFAHYTFIEDEQVKRKKEHINQIIKKV